MIEDDAEDFSLSTGTSIIEEKDLSENTENLVLKEKAEDLPEKTEKSVLEEEAERLSEKTEKSFKNMEEQSTWHEPWENIEPKKWQEPGVIVKYDIDPSQSTQKNMKTLASVDLSNLEEIQNDFLIS